MALNKYRKKIIYDGEKILAIGKQELYPRVYKRTWDLTQYSQQALEKFNLNRAKYVYIGQTEQKYSSQRKQDLKAKAKKGYSINPVFRQFLTNLKEFYKCELKYSDAVINDIIIPDEEILCRCANKEIALRKEKEITGRYYLLSKLKPNKYVLLSDKDSYFKLVPSKKDNTYTLTIKN